MFRNLHLKMQSIILLILVPAILLVTIVMGSLIYSGLYDIIMSGFDHKLRAISSVSGAFINGDEHSRILLARQIKGLAFDPKSHTLYGADNATDYLVSIDTSDGGATDIGPLGFDDIGDLAFDPATNSIYGISAKKSQLVRINPRTGKAKAIGSLNEAFSGLAFDPTQGVLYASGLYLARVNPQTAQAERVGKIGFPTSMLTLDPATHKLYGSDPKTSQLISIDTKTGQGTAIHRVQPLRPASADTQIPKTLLPIFSLEFDPKKDTLYGCGDRLLAINPHTTRATWEPFTFGFYNEKAPLYLNYVEPMRRIRKNKDITFIYTQIMNEGTAITYVLDGQTEAANHSNIGAADNIPDTELTGARNVMTHDSVHLTDIKQWQQWGVLKSAWAPIYDDKQQAVAMAGADVDISIIRKKTSEALAKVGLVAVICLLVSGFVALTISRSLTRPIARVKDMAIQVASGQYTQRIEIQSPLELSKLANSFNAMSQTLETTVTDLTEESRVAERKRRRQHLQRELALAAQENNNPGFPVNLNYTWLANNGNCADSSGAVLSKSQLLVWLMNPKASAATDELKAIKLRSDINEVMRRALVYSQGDWDLLLPMIQEFYSDTVTCLALLDATSYSLKCFARQPTTAFLFDSDQEYQPINLASISELTLEEGQSILITSVREAQLQLLPQFQRVASAQRASGNIFPSRIMAELSRTVTKQEGLAVVMFGGVFDRRRQNI